MWAGSTLQRSLQPRLGYVARLILQHGRPLATRGLPSSAPLKEKKEAKRTVFLDEDMSAKDLADKLRIKTGVVLDALQDMGEPPLSGDSSLPLDILELVTLELGHAVQLPQSTGKREKMAANPALVARPPVVTIMGHVDHGKTTLLDTLRKTSVVAKEAGGITQHIGAFKVGVSGDCHVTFLDTPGHAAFSAMRARGARITDIVVLVIAADDGIKQQTVESIKLVQGSNVPIVVAVNKCDKPNSKPSAVKSALLGQGVQLEEFGGDVQAVEISALKGSNIPALIEAILIQADMMNLRGDPCRPVKGVVIESHKDRGLGAVATVLIQRGTLTKGKYLVAGKAWGKVKALLDDQWRGCPQLTLSQPGVAVGWRDLPQVGAEFREASSEQQARKLALSPGSSEDPWAVDQQLSSSPPQSELPTVPIIIKGDVVGSVEVLRDVLLKSPPPELGLKVIRAEVGPITDSDIETAVATGAKVLGFNTGLTKSSRALSKHHNVEVLTNPVIYRLLDQLQASLEELLPSEEEEDVLGEGSVLDTFRLTGVRQATVAGCRVRKGVLERGATFRVLRKGQVTFTGMVESMKRGREDITKARKDTECGISFHDNIDFETGDTVQCFRSRKVRRKLNWEYGF